MAEPQLFDWIGEPVRPCAFGTKRLLHWRYAFGLQFDQANAARA